jgi:hypothetical protein
VPQHLVRHVPEVLALEYERADELEHALRVADRDRIGERVLHVGAARSDERRHGLFVDRSRAEHRRLIEQRQRVAERTFRLPGHRLRGLLGHRDALFLGNAHQVLPEEVHRAPTEVEPLAPADDRRRHLVRFGGRQDESNARRRFLEHLQQRVERLARQALRLVDDVHLLAPLHRRGGRLFPEITRVVDAAVARRVDLDDVEVLSLADPDALLAHAARLRGRTLLAVDHLGQDPRGRRLAGPARATEQERVRETALAHRAHQRADDVLLAEDLAGALRSVLPVEGLVLLSHAHLREPREA